jgi:excinuclease ABC subunit B
LLGVTGSGKTYTMAKTIEEIGRPALVIAHNKTLAAQLANEFAEFFPNNAVEYFVSYYDYYQPEAYVPRTDTFIEKDAQINEDIDRLRHSATSACSPGATSSWSRASRPSTASAAPRSTARRCSCWRRAVSTTWTTSCGILCVSSTQERLPARPRHLPDAGRRLEVHPAYQDTVYRISFFGDEVEGMTEVDSLTGEILRELDVLTVYPATHYVTNEDRLAVAIKNIEAELEERHAELEREARFWRRIVCAKGRCTTWK